MVTVNERDMSLFYRFIRKIIKEQIKEGNVIDVPARKVFRLTQMMTDHYFSLIQDDLKGGAWENQIRELMTR